MTTPDSTDQATRFVRQIAALIADGETDSDGAKFVMEHDDAVTTLSLLIVQAREILQAQRGSAGGTPAKCPPPATVYVLRWTDRHSDETSVHATRQDAMASLAAAVMQCDDVPDSLSDEEAVAAWRDSAANCDRIYELGELRRGRPGVAGRPAYQWSARSLGRPQIHGRRH